jgi:hypothetical protein
VNNGAGTLQRFLGLYVEWEEFSLQPVATELFQYQFLTAPNFVSGWRTQFLSHGLKGYQSIYRMEGSYSSTTPVEMTITAFDGTSPAIITLPSTGGAYQKILLTPTFNKGQLFRYAFSSESPFQLVLADWIVWIALWGREDTARVFRLVQSESEGSVRI